MEIKFDKDLMEKLVQEQFKGIPVEKWYQTVYYYMIDSKYRTKKRLDKFLSEQLIDPDFTLVRLAEKLRDKNPDITVMNILRWVRDNIKYEYDKDNFGKNEFWATAVETFNIKIDDCDGQNGLIYVLCRIAGIPPYVLYSVIGDSAVGGHYWVVYYSTRNRKLVCIDATFSFNPTKIRYRRKFVLKGDEYQKIWYLFTDKYTFKPGQ